MKTRLITATLALCILSGCATTSMGESTYSGDAAAAAAQGTSGFRKLIGGVFSTPMPTWQPAPSDEKAAPTSPPEESQVTVYQEAAPASETTLKSYPVIQGEGDSSSSFTIEAEKKAESGTKK